MTEQELHEKLAVDQTWGFKKEPHTWVTIIEVLPDGIQVRRYGGSTDAQRYVSLESMLIAVESGYRLMDVPK